MAWVSAEESAWTTYETAEHAAAAAWDAAENSAWTQYETDMAAAKSAWNATEAVAWAMYEADIAAAEAAWNSAEVAARTTFDADIAAAEATWSGAEATAWGSYVSTPGVSILGAQRVPQVLFAQVAPPRTQPAPTQPAKQAKAKPLIDWSTAKKRDDLGKQFPFPDGKGGKGPAATAYEVTLSDGTTILVWKIDTPVKKGGGLFGSPSDNTYNCHGLTCGGKNAPGGPFSPDGVGMDRILKAGFDPVKETDVQVGDIVVYRNKDGIDHSAIISKVVRNKNGSLNIQKSKVTTKDGTVGQETRTLEQQDDTYGKNAKREYHRDKQAPKPATP